MTLEEAERIARNYLPDEPRRDELSAWRASRPRREPPRHERGLDTAPAEPPVDWELVIRQAILGERAQMAEAIGEAIGEYGEGLLDKVERMIEAAVASAVEGLRAEFTRELGQLRSDLAVQGNELFESVATVHSQGERLKAELEAIVAKKTRARATKTNGGSLLSLPVPNGHAQ
jgi:hypothetical protein